ncbi:hypothetical protein N431DRAFT_468749 [Stipitochalara longipes BDJ]|nr:hypothetical protein N431DRAFT_468749 [Stipitochalara longipes BDJ]
MDSTAEASSYNGSLALGLLLLGLVFITFVNPTIGRPKLFILLVAFVTQLPTVVALQRVSTSCTIDGGAAPRKQELGRFIKTGLHPAAEETVYWILMLYAFVVFNLILWAILMFMDLLVPFFPLAFALGCFTNKGLRELEPMTLEESVVATTSLWIVILPTAVFFYSGLRKPQHTPQYMVFDVASVSLGYIQHVVELYQRQQVSWLPPTINKFILAGHLLLSLVHLIYTFDNPIRIFRRMFEAWFCRSNEAGNPNRRARRAMDKRNRKEVARRK